MSESSGNTARKIRAREAVERAKRGEIPEIGEYRLRENGGTGGKITVAEIFMQNTEAEVGDDLTVFGDLRDGWAVVDLNEGVDSE